MSEQTMINAVDLVNAMQQAFGSQNAQNTADVPMRLNNPNKFAVGIITPRKEYGVNILPGAFTMVTQDEVDYLMATSTLLQEGKLVLAGDKQKELADAMGINMEDNANFMSDDEIKKKLSMNANQLRKWLNSGDIKPYVLNRIAVLAKGMNLNNNKLQVLHEKLPDFDFLSNDEE